MNNSLLLSIISSSLLAGIVCAILGHWLSSLKDKKQRLREMRIRYLIDAYRVFTKANRHPRIYEIADELEQAIADIQLFGSPALIKLTKTFTFEMAAQQTASLDEIQQVIRGYLRKELGEKAIKERMFWLQITRTDLKDTSSIETKQS
jgi:RNase P/RNase MRP subunit POP5